MRELTWRLAVKLSHRAGIKRDANADAGGLADQVLELQPVERFIQEAEHIIQNPSDAGFVRGIEEPVRASAQLLRDFLLRAQDDGQRVFAFSV